MRAAIIDTPGCIRVGSVPDPSPGPDELLIRVGACGICGTDLHILAGDSPVARYPIIPGHEFAGEVVALGSNVALDNDLNLTVGSRVAIEPNLTCGQCEMCRTGHENLCLHYRAIGVTLSGAMAEYVTVPIAKAYALPDNLTLREAALIEPVSCAVRGMHSLNPRSGDTFLIAGAGTMGLLLLQLALKGGASRVAVVDVNTRRLARAENLGASRTYTSIQQALADEPSGFNCVIDATGVAPVIEQAFTAVKRSGKLLIFGVAADEARISLSPFRIYNEEITIVGSMAVLASFQPALDLICGGVIDTQSMLTAALPLEDFTRALDLVKRGEGVKTQILPGL
ncbi:alcohol dehydrogenase [Ktedonosporobacter rubrisoli]|uniref:Alcohol dehydrogenase n=1 Tax=Ktedonosporobacter rubrisoli TaxID=2509675 RepID=A0A4P6K421_KTERU|nr:zinc-dependent alcohol dehydrogenase family protein [Ktedonosporobacter rubrisoli]QBD82949.1 alcohol dehydrogenase [Ktedonosporobacter rubrisoli]